jgi:hypothetical protein
MNCQDFNDRLPEYLEDTLSAAEQSAVREHVQKCGVCQQALARQEALAKSIGLTFNRETQRLSLRPETKRNILKALQQPELPPTTWENLQAFFAILWRHPAWAGTALVCLVLLISGGRFYLDSARHSAAAVKEDRATYFVDVPIQTERYVYGRQNNLVVDAVVTDTCVIDASFAKNTSSSRSPQSHVN